jgi:preprotein translocase subunit SecD
MKTLIVALVGAALAIELLTSCGGGKEAEPGVSIVLELEDGSPSDDLTSQEALSSNHAAIDRRLADAGLAQATVREQDGHSLVVAVPGLDMTALQGLLGESAAGLDRTSRLMFCEPVTDESGKVAVLREGTFQYKPQTCDPVRDENGDIIVEGGTITYEAWEPYFRPYGNDEIVWKPATGELRGVETALTGEFLKPNTFVAADPILGTPRLIFEWNDDGADLSEEITARLSDGHYPLASFLDGDPIRGEDGEIIAPSVVSVIVRTCQITGLSQDRAQELATIFNTEALGPLLDTEELLWPMRVIEVRPPEGEE